MRGSEPMPAFVPGIRLCGMFHDEVAAPLLSEHLPGLFYSAALLGHGSEILGFDIAISTDHDWGPRLALFLSDADFVSRGAELRHVLDAELPREYRGFPLDCRPSRPPGPAHRVLACTVASFFQDLYAVDLNAPMSARDWLALPQQSLRTLTGGEVYHDGLGVLEPIRSRFGWYPHDVWLYLMAAEWDQIAEEMAFMGRCGHVGDELGSMLVAGRLVRHAMKLCFLMERQYAPYMKWFGTAFSLLDCAPALVPLLHAAIVSLRWQERESPLCEAYERLARRHNALGVTEPIETEAARYHDRPYRVIGADAAAAALTAAIRDEELRSLHAEFGYIGSVDQFVDCTDILSSPARCRTVANRLFT